MLDERFFDEGLNRVGSDCIKWDACRREHGENTLPMWVADMDFKSPPEVTRALMERAQHPTYGYTEVTAADHEALCAFWKRRHGLEVAHGDPGTGLVDNGADDHCCGGLHPAEVFEQGGPDDDAGQADGDGTRTHGDLEVALLLAEDAAGKGHQAVGDGQAEDLHVPLVLS